MSNLLKLFQVDLGDKPYLGKEGCFRKLNHDSPVFGEKVEDSAGVRSVFTSELPSDVRRFSRTGQIPPWTPPGLSNPDCLPWSKRSQTSKHPHPWTTRRAFSNPEDRSGESLPIQDSSYLVTGRSVEDQVHSDLGEELRTKYGVTFHLPSSKPRIVKRNQDAHITAHADNQTYGLTPHLVSSRGQNERLGSHDQAKNTCDQPSGMQNQQVVRNQSMGVQNQPMGIQNQPVAAHQPAADGQNPAAVARVHKLTRKVVPALRERNIKIEPPIKTKPKIHKIGTNPVRTVQGVDYIRPVKTQVEMFENGDSATRNPFVKRSESHDAGNTENRAPRPRNRAYSSDDDRQSASATIELVPYDRRPSETFISKLDLELTKVQHEPRQNNGGRRLRDIKRKDNVDFKTSRSTPASPDLRAERTQYERRSMRIYTSYSDIDGTTTISSCEVLARRDVITANKPRPDSRHVDFIKGSLRKRNKKGPKMDSLQDLSQETLTNDNENKTDMNCDGENLKIEDCELKFNDITDNVTLGKTSLGLDFSMDSDTRRDNEELGEEGVRTENGSVRAGVETGKGTVLDSVDSAVKDSTNGQPEELCKSSKEKGSRTILDRYCEIQATYKKNIDGDTTPPCGTPNHNDAPVRSELDKISPAESGNDAMKDKADVSRGSAPKYPMEIITMESNARAKSRSPGPVYQSSPILKHQVTPKFEHSRPKSSVSFTSSMTDGSIDLSGQFTASSTLERARMKTNGSFSPRTMRNQVDLHNVSQGLAAFSSTDTLSQNNQHMVVVAIDFGTTYSGYAFSYIRDPRNIHVMRKWDQGDPGVINQKTPTTLLLDPDGKFDSFGFAARDKYHNLIPGEADKWLFFEKFKMMLHHDEGLNPETTIRANNGSLWPALTIFAHALRFFKDHALRELSDQSAMRVLNEDVRWVVTVPAIWKQPAKQFMRLAAYEAGIASPDLPDQLLIALEPEAASIYCRGLKLYQLAPDKPLEANRRISLCLSPRRQNSSFSMDQPPAEFDVAPSSPFPNYHAGDSVDLAVGGTPYMVVDCGGGTVDITVHQLSQLDGKLKELSSAVGSAHGSIDVDKEFERMLNAIFSEDFIQQFKMNRPAGYVDLMIAFEARKRSASPFQDSSFNISIPFSFIDYYKKFKRRSLGSTARRSLTSLQRRSFSVQDGAVAMEAAVKKFGHRGVTWLSQLGMLRLSADVMLDLFQPALEKICAAIRKVIEMPDTRAVQYLFLVGGFAESPILQRAIRTAFEDMVRVVVPQGTALSILRGAVMYGLDPSIITHRKSRLTYGVAVLNKYDPVKHPLNKRVKIGDQFWCRDVFDVFVKIHQSVAIGDSVIRSYSPAKRGQKSCVFNVFCTDRESVRFVTDRGVTRCGTMTLTLPDDDTDTEDEAMEGEDDEVKEVRKRRRVQMRMSFGDTEIKICSVDMTTGDSVTANVNFLCI